VGGTTVITREGPVRFVNDFVDGDNEPALLPLLGSIGDGRVAAVDLASY
jgi:hypothetical protein